MRDQKRGLERRLAEEREKYESAMKSIGDDMVVVDKKLGTTNELLLHYRDALEKEGVLVEIPEGEESD